MIARKKRVPKNVHPLVRRLFEELNAQKRTHLDVTVEAGLGWRVLTQWRTHDPSVSNLDAVFNVLGLELTVKERGT